jgi:hypothetical protein
MTTTNDYQPTGAAGYGQFYWCVGLADEKNTEVYAHADRVEFAPSGGVVLLRDRDEQSSPTLAFAAGRWSFVYAASVIDGSAVSVEHWPGQIGGDS